MAEGSIGIMNGSPDADIAVFTEALRLPPEERDRYLSEACKGDPEFRLRVEALLQAYEQAGDFLDELSRLAGDTAAFEDVIAHAAAAIAALDAEHHRQEKATVGYDAQLQRAGEETARLLQRGDPLVRFDYG